MTDNTHKNLAQTVASLRAQLLSDKLNEIIDDHKEGQRSRPVHRRIPWESDLDLVDYIDDVKQKGMKQIRKTLGGVQFAKKSFDKKTGQPKPGNKVVIHSGFHKLYSEAKVVDVFVDRSAWIIKLMTDSGSSRFIEVRVTKSMTSKVTNYDSYYHGRKKAMHKRDEFGHIIG